MTTSTIRVELWAGQRRGGDNARTAARERRPAAERGMRELFVEAYGRIAAHCRSVTEPGLAIALVDAQTCRPVGLVQLRARHARHVAAVVGRHEQCDLFVPDDARLALRQFAVILAPRGRGVRYRVLDLRTADGFADEHGRTLRGLACDGPALLRCAGYGVFVLPLGDPGRWPSSAEAAWRGLPRRVYVGALAEGSEEGTSSLVETDGPHETGMALVERGERAGLLEVDGPWGRDVIRVGDRALRDGILVGRYARCDGGRLGDRSLSRVHVLLIEVDGTILAIDTASRNGIREAHRERARVITLDAGTELRLGQATRARFVTGGGPIGN